MVVVVVAVMGEVVTITLFVFHPVLPFWGIRRWKIG